jgi:hypothetical protein
MPEEFTQEHLEQILREIALKLSKETKIYIFGGAVMVYKRIKPATKDIDILFDSAKDYHQFMHAAKASGFVQTSVPLEYEPFYLSAMLNNYRTAWRLDLFLRKVCSKFEINPAVKNRSSLFREIGLLKIYFIAVEDIILMKSLTQRDRDLDDIKVLLGYVPEFKSILQALEDQKDAYRREILDRLLEFEERQNLKLSIPPQMREEHERYNKDIFHQLLRKQIKMLLKEGKSKEEIIQMYELNEKEWEELNK